MPIKETFLEDYTELIQEAKTEKNENDYHLYLERDFISDIKSVDISSFF